MIVPSGQTLKIRDDFGGHVPKLEDQPWPAFPADLMSIAIVTATQCDGVILMFEKMFESRMFFVDKLISMGARIVLCDPHRAIVAGPSRLRGALMTSPDIRAGMAMLLAAVCAKGVSTINNADQIERGYERIDERLNALGARITRVPARNERANASQASHAMQVQPIDPTSNRPAAGRRAVQRRLQRHDRRHPAQCATGGGENAGTSPRWVAALMALRDHLVTPFGLKTSSGDGTYADTIGIFPVLSQSPAAPCRRL